MLRCMPPAASASSSETPDAMIERSVLELAKLLGRQVAREAGQGMASNIEETGCDDAKAEKTE